MSSLTSVTVQAFERTKVAARITIGERHHDVWFKTSQGPIAGSVDPFLASSLIPAMKVGGSLRLGGSVSPRLLEATSTIQDLVQSWHSNFRRVIVEVDAHHRIASDLPKDHGCFFSGGVDSFYSILKRRNEITTLIFVHGFDVPLDNRPLRAKVAGALHRAAAELGKPLIEVETNLREFSDQ